MKSLHLVAVTATAVVFGQVSTSYAQGAESGEPGVPSSATVAPAASESTQPAQSAQPAEPEPATVSAPTPLAEPVVTFPEQSGQVAGGHSGSELAAPPDAGSGVDQSSRGVVLGAVPCVRLGPARKGFYLQSRIGTGYMVYKGKGPDGSASVSGVGSSMGIAIGGSIAKGLVLAGTIQGVTVGNRFEGGPFDDVEVTLDDQALDVSDNATAGMSILGLLLDFYPNPVRGWHAGLSVGLGASMLVNSADESSSNGMALGGSVFGGYDWWLGKDRSLGLSVLAAGSTNAKMKDSDGGDPTGYRMHSLFVGLQSAITYF